MRVNVTYKIVIHAPPNPETTATWRETKKGFTVKCPECGKRNLLMFETVPSEVESWRRGSWWLFCKCGYSEMVKPPAQNEEL